MQEQKSGAGTLSGSHCSFTKLNAFTTLPASCEAAAPSVGPKTSSGIGCEHGAAGLVDMFASVGLTYAPLNVAKGAARSLPNIASPVGNQSGGIMACDTLA